MRHIFQWHIKKLTGFELWQRNRVGDKFLLKIYANNWLCGYWITPGSKVVCKCKCANYMKFNCWTERHPVSSIRIYSTCNLRPVIKVTRINNYARELLRWVIILWNVCYIAVDTFLCGATAEPTTIRHSAILCQQEIQRKMWRGAKSKHAQNYNYFMCGICVAYINWKPRNQSRGANVQFARSATQLNKQSVSISFEIVKEIKHWLN